MIGSEKDIDRLFNLAERNSRIDSRVEEIFARTYPENVPAGEFIAGKGWIEFVDPVAEAKRRIRETMLPGGEMGEV